MRAGTATDQTVGVNECAYSSQEAFYGQSQLEISSISLQRHRQSRFTSSVMSRFGSSSMTLDTYVTSTYSSRRSNGVTTQNKLKEHRLWYFVSRRETLDVYCRADYAPAPNEWIFFICRGCTGK